MDRKEKLEIALEVAPDLFDPVIRVVVEGRIQAELDALPKRWYGATRDDCSIGVERVDDHVWIDASVAIGDDGMSNVNTIAFDDATAIDFGMACIKAGDGDVLSVKWILTWLNARSEKWAALHLGDCNRGYELKMFECDELRQMIESRPNLEAM